MQFHMLPWELPAVKRGLQRFLDIYNPRPDINIHLHLIVNLSRFHTDWSKSKIYPTEILEETYKFTNTLNKFGRIYITILSTEEPNGHIDTWKHIQSNFYDGYIMYCSDTYYHKDYLDSLLDIITQTNNFLTWVSPTPDTERYKILTVNDIDNGKITISRAKPGSYCMGFGWFDYISTSIINLIGWPPFECYGPHDSYIGFIMTGLYRALPDLDYGHYYINGDVIKPDCVYEEDEEYKKNFIIKQNKESQRAIAEENFFDKINKRAAEIYERIINNAIIHRTV